MSATDLHAAHLTVQDVLEMPTVFHGQPELLTPTASLRIPIRWTHIIGTDRPGNMLRGGELVLSTLARIEEDHPHPTASLHDYLGDLDHVGAAALMLEILPDRQHLLAALSRVIAERESRASGSLPIFLFRREVRFVRITESVQRELVARESHTRGDQVRPRDPLVSATTNLLDDLAAPGGLPEREAADRATALGIPSSVFIAEAASKHGAFTPLVFRIDSRQADMRYHLQVLISVIREASSKLRLPALIGIRSGSELSVLVSQHTPKRFCRAVREESARRRSHELVPRYLVGLGSIGGYERVSLREAPVALAAASAVAESAALISEQRGERDRHDIPVVVDQQGFWRITDLGLQGLLVHLLVPQTSPPTNIDWFLDHYLAAFADDEGNEMRDLVAGSVLVGENKTELAKHLGISRPTLYGRIRRLESIIGSALTGETLSILHSVLVLEKLRN